MPRAREQQGVIEEMLPRGLYRVLCEDGDCITAALDGKTRQVTVALLPGDRVVVLLSPLDPTRGRITARLG